MKIAHIINNLKAGGAQTFLVSLAVEQCKLGHHVSVILVDQLTDPTFENYLIKKLGDNNVDVYLLNRRLGKNPSIINSFFKLCKTIKNVSPDIVNSHLEFTHMMMGAYTRLSRLFFLRKVEHIITIHNAPEKWNKYTLMLNGSTKSIYCSNAALETSVQRNCIKVVIENGIYAPVLSVNPDEILDIKNINKKNKLILCVGKLSKQKNYALTVEIARNYLDKEITFLICGMPDNTSNEDLAAFETVKNIQYLGVCVPAEIYALMNASDCFLNTSLFEGLPITVLEAFFLGVPCVLSPILPHRDIGSTMPYSYITSSFDCESFVQTIDEVLSLKVTKNDIKAERENNLKRFDITVTAPLYIKFYTSSSIN